MKRILSLFIFGVLLALLMPGSNKALAQENNEGKIKIVYFQTETCSNCKAIKPFLEEIKKEYDEKIEFLEHDVREEEKCRQLFNHFALTYNVPTNDAKTPIIFVGKTYLSGTRDIENNLKKEINLAIQNNDNLLFDCHKFLDAWPNVEKIDFTVGDGGMDGCSIDSTTQCAADENNNKDDDSNKGKSLSLTLIVTTAIIDSINPCAIAVLIFLLGVLLSLKSSRKKIIQIGLVYIGAVFATYYLAGLGLIEIIAKFNIQTEIAIFAGAIVFLAGFLEIKEGLYPDGKQLLRIPEKTKPIFTNFLKKGTIPSVFIAGILVSAFELPCTGQVYLGILSMLSQENMRAQGYLYLFIYNLIFVLPLVIILLIAAWGFDIKRMKHTQKKTRMIVKILMGFIMILLGIFLLFQDKVLRILGI
jgi:cytochrome c biogenesis protein CcdA/glutaredoxin